MSVQFGRCYFDGRPVAVEELDRARLVLARHDADIQNFFHKDNVGIIYRAFHTTKESRLEKQPHLSSSGIVLTWDGRLDNRSELIDELRGGLSDESTDLSIVAAAYEQWETNSFAKLIGDWALSVWTPNTDSVVLAKDFVGSHHIYYSIEENCVTWCTTIDPLVLLAGRKFKLDEEYLAGWLSFFPAAHLTPYIGIHSVQPSCFIRLEKGRQSSQQYWDFSPTKSLRYRADAEYEEHFRSVFAEAVRRRLRSDRPVLAELSGGMDSSSIVCMADQIIAQKKAEAPRLDTVSYYNDSEPNWNERPYFSMVEEKRGQKGLQISVDTDASYDFEICEDSFAATPGSKSNRSGHERIHVLDSIARTSRSFVRHRRRRNHRWSPGRHPGTG